MPMFEYTARNPSGQIQKGQVRLPARLLERHSGDILTGHAGLSSNILLTGNISGTHSREPSHDRGDKRAAGQEHGG